MTREQKSAYHKAWRARTPGYHRKRAGCRRRWRSENKEREAIYWKRYYDKRQSEAGDWSAERARKWRAENPDYERNWREQNKERLRPHRNLYQVNRRKLLPHINLAERMRKRIHQYLKRAGFGKNGRASFKILGCDQQFFFKWIQSLFLPGMNFENRNEWELDHIFPVAACGKNEEQILLASHYRNIKPIWRRENRAKGDAITEASLVAGYLCGLTEIHVGRKVRLTKQLRERAARLGFAMYGDDVF